MKRLAAGALCLLGLVAGVSGQTQRTSGHWVGTWTTASVARWYLPSSEPVTGAGGAQAPANARAVPLPNNQTLRQIVRVTIGGDRVRVVLTNAFGTTPLVVGGAHLALREKESAIVPASDRVLTFSGKRALTIPVGALIVSDPVSLTVPAFADVAIDVYFSENAGAQPVTIHRSAHQTSYLSLAGDHAGAADKLHGARGKESAANIDLHARALPARHACERDGAFQRR